MFPSLSLKDAQTNASIIDSNCFSVLTVEGSKKLNPLSPPNTFLILLSIIFINLSSIIVSGSLSSDKDLPVKNLYKVLMNSFFLIMNDASSNIVLGVFGSYPFLKNSISPNVYVCLLSNVPSGVVYFQFADVYTPNVSSLSELPKTSLTLAYAFKSWYSIPRSCIFTYLVPV